MNRARQALALYRVTWTEVSLGWVPLLSSRRNDMPGALEVAAIPELIQALGDEKHFVTAHVLLTQLSAVRFESLPTWNGLTLHNNADGAVTIDPAQRGALKQRWQRWFVTSPRPATLP
ncbi:hypothetical protein [Massilia sp. CF038]|uniref:hypothetical protein n=1 Tax=Massilia sp. CF038 TaxID=1881045 RepID=UPI00091DCD85|nr:hypothetical protein [Massilia sp. CF038]SHG53398.1 hypothetical protein SAMN05428948_0908 [Massilia sp. CF038]